MTVNLEGLTGISPYWHLSPLDVSSSLAPFSVTPSTVGCGLFSSTSICFCYSCCCSCSFVRSFVVHVLDSFLMFSCYSCFVHAVVAVNILLVVVFVLLTLVDSSYPPIHPPPCTVLHNSPIRLSGSSLPLSEAAE